MTISSTLTAHVPAEQGVTDILADFIVRTGIDDLPETVQQAGIRTFLNWLGCAVGSAQHDAVEIAIRAMRPMAGSGDATVLGRSERFDPSTVALINGISSHVFDFDDTHLKTVIHPAGPVVAALLALAEVRPISGADFLAALILGVEVECRVGNSVFPAHYDVGWHITGTTGSIGAAAACAKLLKLDRQKTRWALGIAATQPVGLREMFGTMTKSFHPGRAAQNGMLAALLAEQGYTSSDAAIEAKRGWANVVSTAHDFDEITRDLGVHFESSLNSYKPFACGIVIHPAIDGCIRLRNAHVLQGKAIASIDLKVNPLVLELTGKTKPTTGLEGKFSVYHACAAAILEGAGGEREFSDELVNRPDVVALRQRVKAIPVEGMDAASATVTVTLENGEVVEEHVAQAIGSVGNPMSDKALEEKFLALTTPIIGEATAATLLRHCWALGGEANLNRIVSLSATSAN